MEQLPLRIETLLPVNQINQPWTDPGRFISNPEQILSLGQSNHHGTMHAAMATFLSSEVGAYQSHTARSRASPVQFRAGFQYACHSTFQTHTTSGGAIHYPTYHTILTAPPPPPRCSHSCHSIPSEAVSPHSLHPAAHSVHSVSPSSEVRPPGHAP